MIIQENFLHVSLTSLNHYESCNQLTVLTLYDPNAMIKVSAHASSFGLGAVYTLARILGRLETSCICILSMSETAQHYTQIENETLPIT